jgi:hypothetical protein
MTEPVLIEVRAIESAQFHPILSDLRYLRTETPIHGLVNYQVSLPSNMVYLLFSRPLLEAGRLSGTISRATRVSVPIALLRSSLRRSKSVSIAFEVTTFGYEKRKNLF